MPKTEVCKAGGFHLLTVNALPFYDVAYTEVLMAFLFCITLLSRYARARFARREKKADFEMRAVVAYVGSFMDYCKHDAQFHVGRRLCLLKGRECTVTTGGKTRAGLLFAFTRDAFMYTSCCLCFSYFRFLWGGALLT